MGAQSVQDGCTMGELSSQIWIYQQTILHCLLKAQMGSIHEKNDNNLVTLPTLSSVVDPKWLIADPDPATDSDPFYLSIFKQSKKTL